VEGEVDAVFSFIFGSFFQHFFFPWSDKPTSLVSVSCVLSHEHVLFAKQRFFVLSFCVFCYVWAASVGETEKCAKDNGEKGRQ